ncbi:hypothetical protein BKI52_13105 [marine bacterium AO1-C]|nr:hypothetical protein BKI52_13105 [marine bacterium AO1-C]
MKTSKKLLIFVAGFALVYLIVGLTLLRSEIQTALDVENKQFKEVSIGQFNKIKFSANWKVKIRQGPKFKVSLASKETAILKPELTIKDGTLYMNLPSAQGKALQAKLVIPAFNLKAIEANGNTTIYLRGYQSDTLRVNMKDKSVFTVKDNKLSHLDFKTSGQARIQLSAK